MRSILLAILLLVAPRGVVALTWDFDDDSTYGWIARQDSDFSIEPLHSEVVDGVWRIAPSQRPKVSLRSPLIGKDSALFDHITLRLRLIHHSPTEGFLLMDWFNTASRRLLDRKGNGFSTHRLQPYPIEWEDITIDLRALAADPEKKIIWQDTLYIFHIDMILDLDMILDQDAQDEDNHPKFLEIDWIQLTGTEELAQGELSPKDIAVEVGPPGTLFAKPDFFPLGEGLGIPDSRRGRSQASRSAVGDVDGDGDADLVAVWNRPMDGARQLVWIVASNNGLGGFAPTQEVPLSTASSSDHYINLRGGDFDGDGLLDLVFYSDGHLDHVVTESGTVELWSNWGGDFDSFLQLSGGLVGLADGDGDGDVDLLVRGYDGKSLYATLWINDGYDFVQSNTLVFDNKEANLYLPAGQPLGEAASLLWNRFCYESPGAYQLTRPWAAIEEPPLFFEAEVNPCALHLLADFDRNGTVDLLGSPERIGAFLGRPYYYGLALWRLDASGVLARHSLLDWKVFPLAVTASDLNSDGVLDVALVAGNLTVGTALVVWLGQRNGAPILEGYYPLPGEGSQVLASDVNGDGDLDLVVLGTTPASSHGGVLVFINQGTPATAIVAEAATPASFALGANYPNPFNPATTIPLTVPTGARNVDLTIYNVLGQPLRQVWTGPLPAGEHRLTWDGRDAQGQPVATGVYVYRLQVDYQTHARKMVKLE